MKIDGYSLLATVDCAEKPSAIEKALRTEGYTFGLGTLDNETFLKNYLHGDALLDAHISGADLVGLCASMKIRLLNGNTQRTVETPRSAAGPDLRFLLLGGAGRAGDIEELALKIRPLPDKMLAATYIAHNLETAVETLRIRVQNFNPPAWVRLTLLDDDIQSDQARLSFGFEGSAKLCEGQFDDFCAACATGFTKTQAPAGCPDGSHNMAGAPPLFSDMSKTHKPEIQIGIMLSWECCAAFMREMKKRSAGIYIQQCVLSKAYHHAALLSLRIYSSGTRDWIENEAHEISELTKKDGGRVLELIDLTGERTNLKNIVPSDPLIERIRRVI